MAKFNKGEYIVLNIEPRYGDAFSKHFIYRQKVTHSHLAVFKDNNGDDNNWSGCTANDKSGWRYANGRELAHYIALGCEPYEVETLDNIDNFSII